MEAVPRMPMIAFELKTSPEQAELAPGLSAYIADHYNENPAKYQKEFAEFESLRQSAINVSKDFMGCSTLKKYYAQLHFLQSRFPMGEGGMVAIPFTWDDVYSGKPITHTDIQYEQAAILYNIGALHSYLGAMDKRHSPEGMKVSCTHFQCAAWAYQELRDKFRTSYSPDMASDLLLFKVNLMLAQAQECILEKSMTDNRKNTITAKVATQIVEYYKMAVRNLESGEVTSIISSRRLKEWKKRLELKSQYYQCIMYLYLGSQAEDHQKWGERVTYLQAAVGKLEECVRLNKGDDSEVEEALKFANDVVGGKYNAAKKDNDFVYHEKVPELASLPEIKGASLVKGIPFSATDTEISGPDIFQKLVPMEAHEASSMYSEEKAKILRKVGEAVDEKDQELGQFMSSLQLDINDLHPQPQRLPQELLEKCAAISVRPNAIKDLVASMQSLSGLAMDVEGNLKDIESMIDEEKQAEQEFQKIYGKRSPNTVLDELRKECSKYQEGLAKASQSNMELHKAMNTHISNLKLLSGPLDELQAAIPALEANRSPEDEAATLELQRLLTKVEEMKNQRQTLNEQFRQQVLNDDITASLVTREQGSNQTFFEEQIKKHDSLKNLIEQNLAAQNNILRALTEANAKYAQIRRTATTTSQRRDNMIQNLIQSYDVYEDLLAKSQKGIDFYQKLDSNVTRLLDRVKRNVKVGQEEREQIVSRLKPKGVPPARPTAAKPSGGNAGNPELPATYSPTSSEPAIKGPTLKDYLPFMKPATFGGLRGTGGPRSYSGGVPSEAVGGYSMGGGQPQLPVSGYPSVAADQTAAGGAASRYYPAGEAQPQLPSQPGSWPSSQTSSPAHLPKMSSSQPASPAHYHQGAAAAEGASTAATSQQEVPKLPAGYSFVNEDEAPKSTAASSIPATISSGVSAEGTMSSKSQYQYYQAGQYSSQQAQKPGMYTGGYPTGQYPHAAAAGQAAPSSASTGQSSSSFMTAASQYGQPTAGPGVSSQYGGVGYNQYGHMGQSPAGSAGQPVATVPPSVTPGTTATYGSASGYTTVSAPSSFPTVSSQQMPTTYPAGYGSQSYPQQTNTVQYPYSSATAGSGVAQQGGSGQAGHQSHAGTAAGQATGQYSQGAYQQPSNTQLYGQPGHGTGQSGYGTGQSQYGTGQSQYGTAQSGYQVPQSGVASSAGNQPAYGGNQATGQSGHHTVGTSQVSSAQASVSQGYQAGHGGYATGYHTNQSGYSSAAQTGYQVAQSGSVAASQAGYQMAQGGYSGNQAGYQQTSGTNTPVSQTGYPASQGENVTSQPGYQTTQPGYQVTQSGGSVSQGAYQSGSSAGQGYRATQSGYHAVTTGSSGYPGQGIYSQATSVNQSTAGYNTNVSSYQSNASTAGQQHMMNQYGQQPASGTANASNAYSQQTSTWNYYSQQQRYGQYYPQQYYSQASSGSCTSSTQSAYSPAGGNTTYPYQQQAGQARQQQAYTQPAGYSQQAGQYAQQPGAGSTATGSQGQYAQQPGAGSPATGSQGQYAYSQQGAAGPAGYSYPQQQSPSQTATGTQQTSVLQSQQNTSSYMQDLNSLNIQTGGLLPTLTPERVNTLAQPPAAGTPPPQHQQGLQPGGVPPGNTGAKLERQNSSSTTSSLDDILSSSPAGARDQPKDCLKPKVITEADIKRQKEEEYKNSLKKNKKDPYDDPVVLDKFVKEVEKFEKSIENLLKPTLSGHCPLETLWKELSAEQENIARAQGMAIARCYPLKNRSPDYMPYDFNRVVLTTGKDDYINASHLDDLSPCCPRFITTQGPMAGTFADFWLMVYEQGTEVIVMLASEKETGQHKNPVYWATEKGKQVHHGIVTITLQSEKSRNGWIERNFTITHKEKKQSKSVVHLQFPDWLPGGVPNSPANVLQFIKQVHYFYIHQRQLMKPVIVHCSLGIGRTGAFCIIYLCVQEISQGRDIPDIPNLVRQLMSKRKYILNEAEQLRFCFHSVLYHAQDILMKRGILTNKASFDDKPGKEISHQRKPSDDFILGPASFSAVQSGVAKMWPKDTTPPKDSHGNSAAAPALNGTIAENGTNSTPGPSLTSGLPALTSGGGNQKVGSAPPSGVSSPTANRSRSGSPASVKSLGSLGSNTASPLHKPKQTFSNLPPALANISDPSTFTIGEGEKKTKKANFDKSGGSRDRTPDPNDPFANLDPLYSAKK